MGAARAQRERLNGGVLGDPHTRRARSGVTDTMHERRDAAVGLARENQNTVSARDTRAACHARQIVSDPHTKRFTAAFQFVTRPIEQGLGLILVDDLNRLGAKPHTHAGGAGR